MTSILLAVFSIRSSRRTACLKYVVLANMLSKSDINPFDSQEAKPYKSDPEILAMTNLISAYTAGDLTNFESLLKEHKSILMSDTFIQEHLQQLIDNCRTQALIKVVQSYNRIWIPRISQILNITDEEVESLLVKSILDGTIKGKIDQVNQVLLRETNSTTSLYDAIDSLIERLSTIQCEISSKIY